MLYTYVILIQKIRYVDMEPKFLHYRRVIPIYSLKSEISGM